MCDADSICDTYGRETSPEFEIFRESLETTTIQRLLHQACSPERAPSDLFVSLCVKESLIHLDWTIANGLQNAINKVG
jgi:hypothetical protein